jgi:two-component system cell cycle response regulator CpdR
LDGTVRHKILVVEDDPTVLKFVAAVLARDGFCVAAAGSAEEALPCIAADDFDLVITDFRMPGRSGDAVVNAVREAGRNMEVIMMTGLATDMPDWIQSGPRAVRILAKPFTISDLRAAVAKAIGAGGNVILGSSPIRTTSQSDLNDAAVA